MSMRPPVLVSLAAGIAAACFCVAWPSAASMEVEHRLEVELEPARRLLSGVDEMTVRTDGRERLVFFLSERAHDLRVEVRGRPRDFAFRASFLEVPLDAEERDGPLAVRIAWAARFDDPVPLAPVNTDNPGFGVSASISEAGAFLLPGSGWYPDLIDARDRFPRIRVQAPTGMLAVTAGRSLGHREEGGFSISSWSAGSAQRGLALAAGRWLVRERPVGEVVAAVYFSPAHIDLAPAYLEAVAAYLDLYTELFGPYPFEKFAVVENFFPTGYGFPSFTLLGGAILRLPFVLERSLAHEIAHCWWGNGVLVDYEQGNWSEGLTTYVSDYLLQARRSEEAAREARVQSLRDYATLVPPEKDVPLALHPPHRSGLPGRRVRQGDDGLPHAPPPPRRGGLLGGPARSLRGTPLRGDRMGSSAAGVRGTIRRGPLRVFRAVGEPPRGPRDRAPGGLAHPDRRRRLGGEGAAGAGFAALCRTARDGGGNGRGRTP